VQPFFLGHGIRTANDWASGAIFGILIGLSILCPDRRVYLFPIPFDEQRMDIPPPGFLAIIRAALRSWAHSDWSNDKVRHICHLGDNAVG